MAEEANDGKDIHRLAAEMFDKLDAEEMRQRWADGTITGRFRAKSDPRFMSLYEGQIRKLSDLAILGIDYSALEDRVAAMLISYDGNGLHMTPITTEQMYQGVKAHTIILDEYAEISKWSGEVINEAVRGYAHIGKTRYRIRDTMPEPEAFTDKPAVKQNGRSASYLDFDKTKQHKRRKPVKRRRG